MKASIEAGGRKVELECSDTNTSPREVLTEVLATWKATDGAVTSDGPAYGFSSQQAGQQQSPMNMGGYGGAGVREVKA